MKTFTPRKEDITRSWFVVNLEGKNLGRTASAIAKVLSGKNKPIYSPHIDTGDFVIVLNADKVSVTGRKLEQKFYRRHSGYPGGFKEEALRDMLSKHPERVIELAVKGMLPKNKLRAQRMKRLKVYCSDSHPHKAQKPVDMNI